MTSTDRDVRAVIEDLMTDNRTAERSPGEIVGALLAAVTLPAWPHGLQMLVVALAVAHHSKIVPDVSHIPGVRLQAAQAYLAQAGLAQLVAIALQLSRTPAVAELESHSAMADVLRHAAALLLRAQMAR